MQLMIWTSKRR